MVPTDTTMPMMPDNVSARPWLADSQHTRPYMKPPHTHEAGDDHEAEAPVVEEHVEGDEGDAHGAGEEAGVERVGAEGGRHLLEGDLVELDGQRAVAQHEGQVLGLALVEARR